jgi:hypothetical protein
MTRVFWPAVSHLIASPVRASPRGEVDDLDGLFARLDRAAAVVSHSVSLLAGQR